MELHELRDHGAAVLDEIERAVVGKRDALELILIGVLADGHVLLEDYPGLAKTLIARSFARATSLHFSRIQFTPDLMPSDVTGSSVFDQRRTEFTFLPGPIFTNILPPTRSTAPRRRRRPRCSRRCRSTR
jgi:MoxR-like ATPase